MDSIDNARSIVGSALEEMDKEEATTQEYKFPELAQVTDELQLNLKERVRTSVVQLITQAVGENDLLLLSALGIDGRGKMLDVFIEECQHLKEEFGNGYGTTRTPHGASSRGHR